MGVAKVVNFLKDTCKSISFGTQVFLESLIMNPFLLFFEIFTPHPFEGGDGVA